MKVIGIGDNVVDEYVHKNMFYPGGNAFNFSAYSTMLGIESAYLGVFGTDDAGEHVRSVARELGIDISMARIEEGENGHAYVKTEGGERVFITSNKGGISREKPLTLGKEDLEYISKFLLASTSISSHIIDELPKIKETNVPLAFDFSIATRDDILERVCPYIDYAIISCGNLDDCDVESNIDKFHNYGAKNVLATMGTRGAIFSNGKKKFECKAHLVEAVDTMGAGDSFLTAFLTNLIKEQTYNPQKDYELIINESLQKASKFSAKICMIEGAFGYGKVLEENDGGKVCK